jgi:nicotinamide phosphoribosyltransferase
MTIRVFPPHATDFYKTGHPFQYPKLTQEIYQNMTPRSNRLLSYHGLDNKHVVFWGLQMVIMNYLINTWDEEFFQKPKEWVLGRIKRRMDRALGEGVVTVDHFAQLHDLGYLPIKIKALPEGSLVPYKVPMFTIRNTLDEFFWLPGYLETAISAELWKICTTATTAYEFRKLLNSYVELTGAPKEGAAFQLHDFSARGMSGLIDGAMCGTGHLLSSAGSDTILAYDLVEEFYGANADVEFIGGGVPATEHCVMCAGIATTDELETYRRLLTETYPKGIVSIVSDTNDYWDVITRIVPTLKPEIMARQKDALGFARLVVRPDSGNPIHIVAGYLPHEYSRRPGDAKDTFVCKATGNTLTEAEIKGTYECLYDTFGGTVNAKGFIDLDEHIGVIYGDSITYDTAQEIYQRLAQKKFSISNLVLGIGSFTYNYVTRDTHGFAIKATHGIFGGEFKVMKKDPKTDINQVKKSAEGFLRIEMVDGEYKLFDNQSTIQEEEGELKTVFEDGKLVGFTTLADARARLGVF